MRELRPPNPEPSQPRALPTRRALGPGLWSEFEARCDCIAPARALPTQGPHLSALIDSIAMPSFAAYVPSSPLSRGMPILPPL
jgi:hypothetical protein